MVNIYFTFCKYSVTEQYTQTIPQLTDQSFYIWFVFFQKSVSSSLRPLLSQSPSSWSGGEKLDQAKPNQSKYPNKPHQTIPDLVDGALVSCAREGDERPHVCPHGDHRHRQLGVSMKTRLAGGEYEDKTSRR